jgi:glycosyltransferase involved in cell wall biosynthesis
VPDGELPFVSLHVPAHNEPPDMVIDTLRSLTRLDYPAFEIIVIDDNTDDPELWHPVRDWCDRHRVKFAHLEDWPGYKSGALNYALGKLTDDRAEIIGVVDSDCQLEPGFLRRCAPLFAENWVGFTQAPQDYRDWQGASYYRRLYYSYKYFFAVSQPSRNERDGAIFAGTMGLIRRMALEQLGGWDEWCITEDAELSLRLLRAGWSGLHVDESWGRGIMPLTFEALKVQRYRWCFGGIQILRKHFRSMLPGRMTKENRLSAGQRWSYLTGAIQWYGDLLGLIFLAFLLAGAANLATGGGELFRKLTVFLVATVPVLVLLGLVRAVALLRRGTGASWRDALGAFFIWQSTSVVVARASVLALFAKKAAFLRTPQVQRAGILEGIAARELGREHPGRARSGRHCRRTDPAHQLAGPPLAALLLSPLPAVRQEARDLQLGDTWPFMLSCQLLLDTWPRRQRSFRHEPPAVRSDRQPRLAVRVVARGHHLLIEDLLIEGHPDHGVSKRLRHEREYCRIVVAEVVAEPERVVDTSSVETRNVSLIIPEATTEQVDFLLRLAAVLPGQQAAGWYSRLVEAERVRSDR